MFILDDDSDEVADRFGLDPSNSRTLRHRVLGDPHWFI
jgi:hypothetical protein